MTNEHRRQAQVDPPIHHQQMQMQQQMQTDRMLEIASSGVDEYRRWRSHIGKNSFHDEMKKSMKQYLLRSLATQIHDLSFDDARSDVEARSSQLSFEDRDILT